jgi:hypothetical protein
VKDIPSAVTFSRRSRLQMYVVMTGTVHDDGCLGGGEGGRHVTDTLMNPVWQNSKEF